MCVYICLTFNWMDNDDNVNRPNNINTNININTYLRKSWNSMLYLR